MPKSDSTPTTDLSGAPSPAEMDAMWIEFQEAELDHARECIRRAVIGAIYGEAA